MELLWAFHPDTGECLGALQCVNPGWWRTSVWTSKGLRPGPAFRWQHEAIDYLKNRPKRTEQ